MVVSLRTKNRDNKIVEQFSDFKCGNLLFSEVMILADFSRFSGVPRGFSAHSMVMKKPLLADAGRMLGQD